MNSKMTTNLQLLTIEPKQTNKQANNQNKNRITEMKTTGRVFSGGVGGDNGEQGTENKLHKWQVENRQGEVQNSIGNVEAKELTCTTHVHELKGGMLVGGGVQGRGE